MKKIFSSRSPSPQQPKLILDTADLSQLTSFVYNDVKIMFRGTVTLTLSLTLTLMLTSMSFESTYVKFKWDFLARLGYMPIIKPDMPQ